MKLFKETIAQLTSAEFFSGMIHRVFGVLLSIAVFAAVIACYIYKPIILLYMLIFGMLVMGWFMLYFIFPEIHERLFALRRLLAHWLAKWRSK